MHPPSPTYAHQINECQKLFSQTFPDSTETFTKPSGNTANALYWAIGDESNCRIALIWFDAGYTVTANQISNGFNGVATTCFPSGTGGTAVEVGGRFKVAITNNPDYNPPEEKRGTRMIEQGVKPEKERGAATIEARGNVKRAEGVRSWLAVLISRV